MTQENSMCTRPIRNCRGEGYCNTLSLEGTVPEVRQIPAMNYTRNHRTNLIQFHTMFCAENCVLLRFQSCPCARQRCVKDVLFFQGCFDKIQGLLGKIQGLFKDLNKFFNFQGLFKGLMLFQGLFKARANHVI